jgi:hypothetical protein
VKAARRRRGVRGRGEPFEFGGEVEAFDGIDPSFGGAGGAARRKAAARVARERRTVVAAKGAATDLSCARTRVLFARVAMETVAGSGAKWRVAFSRSRGGG